MASAELRASRSVFRRSNTKQFTRPSNWKPDPAVDSHKEIVAYMFLESENKSRNERNVREANDRDRVIFMSMAFSIVVAFMIEEIFKKTIGPVTFDKAADPGTMTTAEKVSVDVLWFAVTIITFPGSAYLLRHVHERGCRERSFLEDGAILWKLSTKTMIFWSFKDVTVSCVGLIAQQWLENGANGEPSTVERYWFNDYSETNLYDTFKYLLISSGVTAAAILLTLLVLAALQQWNVKHPDTKLKMARNWVKDPPFLLGIGMVQARMSVTIWYLFPWSIVNEDVPLSVYGFAARIISCFVVTALAVLLMKILRKREHVLSAPLDDPSHNISWWWLREYSFALFVRSTPFAFSYQWTQLTYEAFFGAMFDCIWPFYYCGQSTIWMWAAYSAAFWLVTYFAIPILQASSAVLKSHDRTYSKTLLRGDKNLLLIQRVSDEMFATLFSIGLGWAFINTVQADCVTNITPTCPDTITALTVSKYAVTVGLFLMATVAGFHFAMSGSRLRSRANIVTDIDTGNCNHLFCEVDSDQDGHISMKELNTFLNDAGFDRELFIEAFDQSQCVHCDNRDDLEDCLGSACIENCPGKSVDTSEIVINFTEIVHASNEACRSPRVIGNQPTPSCRPTVRQYIQRRISESTEAPEDLRRFRDEESGEFPPQSSEMGPNELHLATPSPTNAVLRSRKADVGDSPTREANTGNSLFVDNVQNPDSNPDWL